MPKLALIGKQGRTNYSDKRLRLWQLKTARLITKHRAVEPGIAIQKLTRDRIRFETLLDGAFRTALTAEDPSVRMSWTEHAMRLSATLNTVRDRLMRICGWPSPPKWGDRGSDPLKPASSTPTRNLTLDAEPMDSPASPSATESPESKG